ncbi:hypothetical protein L6V77_28220 [Myxococcota bacterium]|nr:hypothetical protein [Myxococcota bacterium]
MEPITAGPLLSRTFSLFFRHFGPFTVITLLVNLPAILVTASVILSLDRADPSAWQSKLQFAERFSQYTGFITGALASGAISYGVMQDLRGRPVGFGECLSVGFGAMPRIIVISLLTGLATLAGFLLLIIPGVIVSVMLSTAPVVGVVERLGGVEALKRSASLTEGHRWQIFALYFVLGLLILAPSVLVGVMAGNPGATLDEVYATIVQVSIIGDAAGVLVGALFATAPAVIYHALRTQKEGADTEAIASVFD